MTPKEMAKELRSKFYSEIGFYPQSKRCALIAVEALIKENEQIEEMVGQGFNLDFWQQVKTEIEQL